MESITSSGIRIEKLNERNLHSWRQKIELVLGHREVDDMIDPILCPDRPEDSDELPEVGPKGQDGTDDNRSHALRRNARECLSH